MTTEYLYDQTSSDQMRHWRERLHEIVFEADTRAGRVFDLVVITSILLSVIAVMLETVPAIRDGPYGHWLLAAEWGFTILFTIEYLLRLIAVKRPGAYARSFYGIVDILAILPTYLSPILPGAQAFLLLRMLRLMRLFRVLKLGKYVLEMHVLGSALRESRRKIIVFLIGVLMITTISGATMYLAEGAQPGFDSLPESVYWAIVTLTTVGFGDVVPVTILGKFLAAVLMVVGFGVIAVPTGIVSAEIARADAKRVTTQACRACMRGDHAHDATFCRHCGEKL